MTQTNTQTENPMFREVVMTRTVDAPREVVFAAWTEANHMRQWWGPHHFTNTRCDADARPGGKLHIVMRSPDGVEYGLRGEFRVVEPPEKVIFQSFAEDGEGENLLDALTTVTLSEHDGKTRMIVRAAATGLIDYAPMFLDGMEAGWTQSLEKLDEFVAQVQV